MFCYNHKAGSSTWLAAYAKLVEDTEFATMINKTHKYYK